MTESHRNKRFLSRNQVLYRIFPLRCPRWPWNGELITIRFYKSFITCSCHGLGSDSGGVESITTRAGSQGIMAACYSLKYPHSGYSDDYIHQWPWPWKELQGSSPVWWVELNGERNRRHLPMELNDVESRRPWHITDAFHNWIYWTNPISMTIIFFTF